MSTPIQRKHVIFSGHVQGVGFRYTTCAIARGKRVTGFVENLDDGRVRLIVEGPGEEIECLLAEIGDRMRGYIDHSEQRIGKVTGEFDDFRVRYH